MQNGDCDRFNNITLDDSDDNGLEVVVEEQISRSDEGQ